jgi:hypothetical protein
MNPNGIFFQPADVACERGRCSTELAGYGKDTDLARRSFLCSAIAGTAVVLASAAVIHAQPASAQSTLTPEAALKVLGHGNCGAVKATIEGKAMPGQISALYAPIRPAVDAAGTDLDATIDANAGIQATLLSRASPIIAGAIQEGETEGRAGPV